MIKSTPHAHTTHVDGKSTAAQMVAEAVARGFDSIGFSEHGVQDFDFAYCLSEAGERNYIAEIGRLQAEHAGQIAIYLGCERDAYSTADRTKYEYIIGSVHYLDVGGEKVAVDGLWEQLLQTRREHFAGDGLSMAEAYFACLAGYIEGYRPEMIGHFDLIQKHNAGGALFDAAHRRYEAAAMAALERMANTDAIMEINTGGMARGYRDWPYPEVRWLRAWRALGGRVALSSDCHDATKLDFGYDAAREAALAAGYREAWALDPRREALFVATEI